MKKSSSVKLKIESPPKLKFQQLEIEQDDMQFRRK
jgi:hypothetical protein